MINLVEFEKRPLIIGERRRLVLTGDEPFVVSTSCFVNNPPPPGFRPCTECSTQVIFERQAFVIEATVEFWRNKQGRIDINIKDSVGEMLKLQLEVLPHADIASGGRLRSA